MWLGEVKMGEYRVGLKQISCEDIDGTAAFWYTKCLFIF